MNDIVQSILFIVVMCGVGFICVRIFMALMKQLIASIHVAYECKVRADTYSQTADENLIMLSQMSNDMFQKYMKENPDSEIAKAANAGTEYYEKYREENAAFICNVAFVVGYIIALIVCCLLLFLFLRTVGRLDFVIELFN